MPHSNARRPYGVFGGKASKYVMRGKIKRLFSQINRDISMIESRIFKQRGAHA